MSIANALMIAERDANLRLLARTDESISKALHEGDVGQVVTLLALRQETLDRLHAKRYAWELAADEKNEIAARQQAILAAAADLLSRVSGELKSLGDAGAATRAYAAGSGPR